MRSSVSLSSGRVLRDRRAGADRGACADLHRRHQHRARADERARADLGAPLVHAVVVAGDGAGADVHLLADRRVAEVGEVVGLGAALQLRLLHLDEVADVHVLAQQRHPAATAQTDRRLQRAPDTRTLDHAVGVDLRCRRRSSAVADHDVRADAHAIAERHGALEHDVHVDEHVAADDDRAARIEPRRIDQRRRPAASVPSRGARDRRPRARRAARLSFTPSTSRRGRRDHGVHLEARFGPPARSTSVR